MAKITKDMIISQVVSLDQRTIPVLLNAGMHCLGCPMSAGESLEAACAGHGINADALIEELNKAIAD